MGEQRSPKPQGGGSSPSTPALFSWVWCLLPPSAKYIWSVSLRFYLNAFHISWDGISFEPHVKAIRSVGVCEHIHHILTGTRVFLYPHTFLFLPQKSGIHYKIERGAETILGITWDPLIASSEADLSEAIRASHHHI